MGNVVLPNELQDGTDAFGSEVKANDDEIVATVNGGIENINVASNADLEGSKLKDLSVIGSKVAQATLSGSDKLIDGSVTGIKMADDLAGVEGQGANLSELFSESDNAGITNVIVGREQHGGKSVWFYFTILRAATPVEIMIDDSIDWRYRMIRFVGNAYTTTGSPKTEIPGGTGLPNAYAGLSVLGSVVSPQTQVGYDVGFAFLREGGDGSGDPRVLMTWGQQAGGFSMYMFADSAGGALKMIAIGAGANEEMDVEMVVDCSPSLGSSS